MLDKIQSFFGFTTMPYGRGLAPGMLFHSGDHAQAAARIGYGIATRGITVITGEVEPGSHYIISFPWLSHPVQIRAGCCVVMGLHGHPGRATGCSGLDATSWPRRFMALQRTRRLAVVAVGWPGPCVGHG